MRLLLTLALLIPFVGCSQKRAVEVVSISGPFKHENLSVYLIHGADRSPNVKYLTLQEAIASKRLIVHETGNVNELSVENTGEQDVYIQSGEIVKGGQQDRALASDMIVSARSGKLPIASFCVEHGRWAQRGEEARGSFSGSKDMVAGQAMKLASNANYKGNNQNEVWERIADSQRKLQASVGDLVAAESSPSSFQLTMENNDLDRKLADYIKQINYEADARGRVHGNVVGWCYAVNGKIIGANVYNNSDLFWKLWPKLLKSGAVEAIAERNVDPMTFSSPKLGVVTDYLTLVNKEVLGKEINQQTRVSTTESAGKVMLETKDTRTGEIVHRCYMTVDHSELPRMRASPQPQTSQTFEIPPQTMQRQPVSQPTTQRRQW